MKRCEEKNTVDILFTLDNRQFLMNDTKEIKMKLSKRIFKYSQNNWDRGINFIGLCVKILDNVILMHCKKGRR